MHMLLHSATLSTTHLQFSVRVTAPLELDVFSGSALRGSFFNAIWRRFCTNRSAPVCADCPLHDTCAVSAIVAPLREDHYWGQNIPRPYIITPSLEGARRYAPGEGFSFSITLIGTIVDLLPYIILSIPQLEQEGLGARLEENQWRRGQYQVEQVAASHPFSGERQVIYEAGKTHVQAPTISVQASECVQRAEQLRKDRLTLELVTPLRLEDQQQLVKRASFRPLLQRLCERYLALERNYGNPEVALSKE
jgi:hypothetical protein